MPASNDKDGVNPASQGLRLPFEDKALIRLAFRHDGARLIALGPSGAQVWDSLTGQPIEFAKMPAPPGLVPQTCGFDAQGDPLLLWGAHRFSPAADAVVQSLQGGAPTSRTLPGSAGARGFELSLQCGHALALVEGRAVVWDIASSRTYGLRSPSPFGRLTEGALSFDDFGFLAMNDRGEMLRLQIASGWFGIFRRLLATGAQRTGLRPSDSTNRRELVNLSASGAGRHFLAVDQKTALVFDRSVGVAARLDFADVGRSGFGHSSLRDACLTPCGRRLLVRMDVSRRTPDMTFRHLELLEFDLTGHRLLQVLPSRSVADYEARFDEQDGMLVVRVQRHAEGTADGAAGRSVESPWRRQTRPPTGVDWMEWIDCTPILESTVLVFSPCGRWLAAGPYLGSVYLWRIDAAGPA